MRTFLNQRIENSSLSLKALAENKPLQDNLVAVLETCVDLYQKGATFFIAGNGGSASDSQHFSAELVAKLGRNRTPIRSWSLASDMALLTAIGNDYGYDFVFSRQLEAHAKPGDVFFAISTSGNSKNILKALEVAKQKSCFTVLLTGGTGGLARGLADRCLAVGNDSTPFIQESHIVIYHTFCEMLEKRLVEVGAVKYL